MDKNIMLLLLLWLLEVRLTFLFLSLSHLRLKKIKEEAAKERNFQERKDTKKTKKKSKF